MMTTMAALLGGLPLAFGQGIGSGVAPSAGYRDGWWIVGQSGLDSLTRRR